MNMKTIIAIALNTFRESVREKILVVSILFGVALMGSSAFLSPLAVGARQKIVMDVGLAAISIVGVLAAILLGSALVHKEIDRKAIYLVLTRPVSRPAYLVGKLLGTLCAVVLVIATMAVVMLAIVASGGGPLRPALFAAIYLSLLETAVVCSVVLFFSTFTTPMLTSFFALCVFAAGSMSNDLKVFASKFGGGGTKLAADIFYYLLPNLRVFNLRHEAVHALPFRWSDVALATAYGLVYCAVSVVFACLIFRRREFA
jgi:ABC-type transport system involved in multi-copper enzyme maturation permease subunit